MNYENKYVYVSTGYQDKNSTSYRSRDDPSSLAFVVAGYAALLLLLHSLRRFETQQLADGASTDDHSLRFRTYVPRMDGSAIPIYVVYAWMKMK
jgi:hypothetical protein